MICRESDRASDRFGRLRCLRFTAPKGARQRMGNYFYLVVAGAVAEPEKGVGVGGIGPCISPGAPVRAYPLGHQPETLFSLERAIPKRPIFYSNGPFLMPRDCYCSRG